MANKDTPMGLMARVASLVRTPAGDAPPSGAAEPADSPDTPESGKQAIKRMIERKAHNDAVRQREFSQLRRLRQYSSTSSEAAAPESLYPDSSRYLESEERASTLKKIDEIEAQMSRQWWQSRQGALTTQATSASDLGASGNGSLLNRDESVFAATLPTNFEDPFSGAAPTAAPGQQRPMLHVGLGSSVNTSDFSSSKMVSIDMGQALSDPVLEDAAIRFANKDDSGAESVLAVALKSQTASPEAHAGWSAALLDLYRSTGRSDSAQSLLQELGPRPARLAPRRLAALPEAPARPVNVDQPGHWQAPAVLDKPAVNQLAALMAGPHGAAGQLDWQRLKIITPEAAQALTLLLSHWCEQPLTLAVEGTEVLLALLRAYTPASDTAVDPLWWRLRQYALRTFGTQDEFELAAMDFCVTYQMFPPQWEPPRCRCVPVQHNDAPDPLAPGTWLLDDNEPPTQAVPLDASLQQVALVGELLGAGAPGLLPLHNALQADGGLVVDCTQLVRVDFSAAGDILNWVASAQAEGKLVTFTRVSHLVAAFFNLIGINEHARVTARAQ